MLQGHKGEWGKSGIRGERATLAISWLKRVGIEAADRVLFWIL